MPIAHGVVDQIERVQLVRGPEPVEEVHERHARFERRQYEAAIAADGFLVMAHGPADEVLGWTSVCRYRLTWMRTPDFAVLSGEPDA